MATTTVNGITVNKITKSQFEAEKLAGNITAEMEQNEVWLFSDDQHVSSSEKVAWNAKSDFSGSYNDLTDKPTIPSVPTNVSAFNNDAGYLTEVPEDYVTNQYLVQALTNYVADDELASVATSGSYEDLTNKPNIPDVSGLETKADANAKLTEAKAYADTKVADLVNSAPTTLDTLGELATAIQENETVVDALNSAIGNKANTSDLAAVATSGSYNDLTNKPTLFSGSYNDLSDKPTIPTVPTKVSAFTNDAGYLTAIPSEYVTETELNAKGYLTEHQDLSSYAKKTELFSKSYNDLTNKPTIYTAITKIWS